MEAADTLSKLGFFASPGKERCRFREGRSNFGSPGRATDARQGKTCLEGRWERPVTAAIAFGEDTPKGHQRLSEFK